MVGVQPVSGQYIKGSKDEVAKLLLATGEHEKGRRVSECVYALQSQRGRSKVSCQHGCML